MTSTENIVATTIRGIGIAEIAAGVIAFFILVGMSEGDGILFAVLVLIGSIVGGTMLLGFGEIIALLADIAAKLKAPKTADPADVLPSL